MSRQGYTKDLCSHLFTKCKIKGSHLFTKGKIGVSRQGHTKDLCSHLLTKGKIGVKAGIHKGSVFSPIYQR